MLYRRFGSTLQRRCHPGVEVAFDPMDRVIVGLRQDAEGDWVAELECGHAQHVRHRPPFEQRPWVLAEETRAERIGTLRDCPLCDRSLLPDEGGEAACLAQLVCPECGVVLDGGAHRPDCPARLR